MLDTLGLREKITLVIINNSQTNTNLTHTTNIYGINPETKELPEDFAQSLNTAYELYKELQSESPDVRAYFQMNRVFPNENYFEIINFIRQCLDTIQRHLLAVRQFNFHLAGVCHPLLHGLEKIHNIALIG